MLLVDEACAQQAVVTMATSTRATHANGRLTTCSLEDELECETKLVMAFEDHFDQLLEPSVSLLVVTTCHSLAAQPL